MKEIPIIFENDEIFIINKPAGVSVQGGEGISHPLDVEFSKKVGYKIHLVHRLDKETCGLMIIAKNAKAASKWIQLISSKQVQKEYTAICFGEPLLDGKKQKSGTITDSLIKRKTFKNQEMSAVTHFEVEETFTRTVEVQKIQQNLKESPENSQNLKEKSESTESIEKIPLEFSKIRLTLGTGRMHQIRIHLASVSAPICGDDKHGDFRLNKIAKKSLKIKNLLLCSKRLTLPIDGKERTFEIELPEYFLISN